MQGGLTSWSAFFNTTCARNKKKENVEKMFQRLNCFSFEHEMECFFEDPQTWLETLFLPVSRNGVKTSLAPFNTFLSSSCYDTFDFISFFLSLSLSLYPPPSLCVVNACECVCVCTYISVSVCLSMRVRVRKCVPTHLIDLSTALIVILSFFFQKGSMAAFVFAWWLSLGFQ